ncbi:uncharacterized protein LOC100574058 [Acyrthosiphon pisum]|uniref:Uncharacterized protein n=1 Tax=Acyrthosiphon pisum TaxID=7029 RepID=A0A8R2NPN2_ACYPI|nr:uncharacterized protein LOC100574058 [Acyrthosiphon pisum]XP_016657228.1 uncharacterized protein LOC100574058 [Acyrthosiphon pisum]XP_016657229.1 uncharacterized protein LOC100574058 [Acyrthosiphon pisum]XP_029342583.1 uncharacterized protein LOC100574058 [Acyrthosiphon pisum]|eukprot:XP_003242241.1 PREDICTED: uncharacterized protein LOC100574058 [Acyrthosiphon pisum]
MTLFVRSRYDHLTQVPTTKFCEDGGDANSNNTCDLGKCNFFKYNSDYRYRNTGYFANRTLRAEIIANKSKFLDLYTRIYTKYSRDQHKQWSEVYTHPGESEYCKGPTTCRDATESVP